MGNTSAQTAPSRLSPMPDSAKRVEVAANYGRTPLSFEANHGQTDPQVRFFSRGSGYSIFLTDTAAVFSLTKTEPAKPNTGQPGIPPAAPAYKTESVRMELVNPAPAPHLVEEDRLPGNVNYFIGKDASKWHRDVPTFRKVRYEGVYPGVDLVYHGNQNQLEFDFEVAPNADPKPIRLHFAGAQTLNIDEAGNLKVTAQDGNVEFHKPVLYQEIAGERQPVQGSFTLAANNTVSFSLGAYDHSQALVIDPILSYSTYLNGSGPINTLGYGNAVAVDASGNIYVAGFTASIAFPVTTSAFQTSSGNGKSSTLAGFPYVSKFDPTGTTLLYSTYLSGSGFNVSSNYNNNDFISSIAVDRAGNLYLAGFAISTDFPVTSGALQSTRKTGYSYYNPNGFVTKLNASGSALLYSTYLGGSGSLNQGDSCNSLAIDSAGNAYVTGTTYSTDFPTTTGAFQQNRGPSNKAFVSKINPSGTGLIYSTYLGGSLGELGNTITVDSAGDAYIGGSTYSKDFPVTSGAYQSINMPAVANRGFAGFIAELNPAGSNLVYATYLAGSGRGSGYGEQVTSLALDSNGNIYAAGVTPSLDFPTMGAAIQTSNKTASNSSYYTGYSYYNAFVSKFGPSGSSFLYSTYFGSTRGEISFPYPTVSATIALDTSGDVFLLGTTYGTDLPVTSNAFQTRNNAAATTSPANAYLAELSPAGALLYCSYFGGTTLSEVNSSASNGDNGWAMALDANNHVYITGLATSYDFPITPGAYQTSKTTLTGAYLAKFLFDSSTSTSTITTLVPNYNPQLPSTSITFTSSVQSVAGNGIPTGSITFSVDGRTASTVPLSTAGRATFTIATLTGGSHTITANYPGDAHNAASSNTMTEIIAGAPARITIYSGNNQTTITGTALPAPIVTLVVDANGYPVPNTTVTYTGSFVQTTAYSNPSAVTDSNGRAFVYLVPSTSGTVSGTATVSGVNTPAYFTYTSNASLGTVATPSFSVASGVYITPQTVSISATTPSATIYYTTNGNPPTTNSYLYTGPITVSSTETIQAIAVATNYTPSTVATATYTINSVTNPQALQFVPVTPCRIADTRNASGSFGGPIIAAGVAREFDIPQSACGIPATALAYSLNVTVVPPGPLGFLTMWPTGLAQPNSSTLNSDGRVKANAAIIPAGNKGGVNVYVSSASHVILDINGYFVAAGSTTTALAFYPVNPCRIADTRNAAGSLGGPSIAAQGSRAFPIQSSSCGIPSTAQAYSLNVTAVPRTNVLNYITTWPTGQSQPNVSTLNASTGAVTANAAIVPAGTGGNVSFYASDATDLVLDVNGYFAPPASASGGLSLYVANPCRIIDTRSSSGLFNGTLVIPIATSSCAPSPSAQAYVLNATVVPPGPIGYLSLWPDSQAQPQVSTLNANDGVITSNLAIVPVLNGNVDAYTSSPNQLILDLSSFFAP